MIDASVIAKLIMREENYVEAAREIEADDETLDLAILEVALLYASRAMAAMDGKNYVTPDHVKSVAKLVFNHRIILRGGSMNPLESRREVFRILDEILEEVPTPR